MNTGTGRIVLSKATPPSIEMKEAPFSQARRWRSDYETRRARQWPIIFMTQHAYRAVNAFASASPDREVGGMLIGQVCMTPEGERYVIIEEQLEARHASSGATHLTFTSNTQTDALTRLEEEHPDKQIVGWYHTHPGMSVFLSSYDVWLHSHFFPQPWHIALVIDPLANHGGFFWYASEAPGLLHPQHYIGFYELAAPGESSAVTWHNMLPAQAEPHPARPAREQPGGQLMEGYLR